MFCPRIHLPSKYSYPLTLTATKHEHLPVFARSRAKHRRLYIGPNRLQSGQRFQKAGSSLPQSPGRALLDQGLRSKHAYQPHSTGVNNEKIQRGITLLHFLEDFLSSQTVLPIVLEIRVNRKEIIFAVVFVRMPSVVQHAIHTFAWRSRREMFKYRPTQFHFCFHAVAKVANR